MKIDTIRHCALCLVFAFSANATATESWQIVSQQRTVDAVATVQLDSDNLMEDLSATTDLDDFGHFSETIAAEPLRSIGGRFAEAKARAIQNSVLATNRISAHGSAYGRSNTNGSGSFAETDAFSNVYITFELAAAGTVRLTGLLQSDFFGQAGIELVGGAGAIDYRQRVQGTYETLSLNEEWELPAGVYYLFVDAFADTEAAAGSSDYQRGLFSIELELITCSDPSDPVTYTNVPLAVTDFSNGIYRNLDPDGGADWTVAGALDSSVDSVQGITRHPITGDYYLLFRDSGGQSLGVLNVETLELTSSVSITNSDPLAAGDLLDIAFYEDGTLYGVYPLILTGIGALGEVNSATGTATPLNAWVTIDATDGAALAFMPASPQLLIAAGNALRTYDVLSADSGDATPPSFPVCTAIAFHPVTGAFVAATGTGAIRTIDLGTGAATPYGSVPPAELLSGLEFIDSITVEVEIVCGLSQGDFGDPNLDGILDLGDHAEFVDCMTGPGGNVNAPLCLHFDYDFDGDCDLRDFSSFQISITPP